MALLKALCLLLCTACYQISIIGHGVVPNAWETVVGKRAVKHVKTSPIVAMAFFLCNGIAWIAVACTGLSWYLARTDHDSLWIRRLCPLPVDDNATQSLTTSEETSLAFFAGTLICLIGTATKLLSQRTLGYMYNSSLNLRPAHRLVTYGPYVFVRHPGYSGAIMSVIGLAVAHAADPSYFTTCGIMRVGYARAGWTWIIWSGAWCISLIVRATKEDEVLAERFGVEWKHWKWNVSKRFIPWVI